MRAAAKTYQLSQCPSSLPSALGFEQDNFRSRRNLLKPVWGISQTQQVWLDHQVYESEGELRFNWILLPPCFPDGQVERQFAQYCALLNRMAEDDSSWAVARRPGSRLSVTEQRAHRLRPERTPAAGRGGREAASARICDALEVVGEPVAPVENF